MTDKAQLKEKARKIYQKLKTLYPDAECELVFHNPFEVLIATVLSAQCTDKKVNSVTPELFGMFPDPGALAAAESAKVESIIKSLGLYKNKAKNIIAASQDIVDRYDSAVPETMEELVSLAGVGRKTANCVLVNAFDKPGIMVDTHCIRLSGRLGLTVQERPEKIEAELKDILDSRIWGRFSHRIILHGRRVCHSRKPECDRCTLTKLCDYYQDGRA